MVIEGEIEARTSSLGGDDARFACFGPGAVVGEMASLDGRLRSTDTVATRRSRVLRIPRAPLIEALKSDRAAALALVAELATRLRAANAALEAARLLDLVGARRSFS